MSGQQRRMTIGDFSARSRLSMKALRLYDSLGLLTPAEVDPVTGYRLYDVGQLERARHIGALRAIGMPLARIGEVIELTGFAAAEAIRGYWQHAEAEHAGRRSLTRYLEGVLAGGRDTVFEINTREAAATKVLAVQRRVTVHDLPPFIGGSMVRLSGYLADNGAVVNGSAMAIYRGPVNEDGDGPVEVCVPFTGSVEPVDDMAIRVEPAHREAYTTLTKSQFEYPAILQAYHALDAWLSEHKAQSAGPPREVYFTDFDAAGDDDLVADVAWPYTD
jgi:DNA-binding transcriptional MerR regulator